jgi:GAF domain/ANTAR domain
MSGGAAPPDIVVAIGRHGEDDRHVDDRPHADAVLDVVRVTGASISTMGGILAAETVSSTDRHIARVDELQFDLGEGPCWDALAAGRPVLEPDLRNASPEIWPALASALRDEPIRALFAFPMRVGPLVIGAIDLYDVRARGLDRDDVALVVRLAEQTGKRVLRRALRLSMLGEDEPIPPHARRVIHQATGFVIAQLHVPADEAELLIRASAFAEGRPMQEIAEEIVARRRRFSLEGTTIEDE